MQKEGIMKRIPTRLTFAIRSLLVIATVAILCGAPVATTLKGDENDQMKVLLYTGSSSGGSAELFAMEVSGRKITTTDIGPLNGGDCASLAMSPSGTLF